MLLGNKCVARYQKSPFYEKLRIYYFRGFPGKQWLPLVVMSLYIQESDGL